METIQKILTAISERLKQDIMTAEFNFLTDLKNEILLDLQRQIEVKEFSSKQDVLSSFPLGCKVKKIKGYKFEGTVVANFKTLADKERLVIDNGDGMLHIFNAEQLERDIA